MRVLWLLCLAACGYSTVQAQSLPSGYTRVFVNQAMDNALDVGPAATLTRVLRERIDGSRVARLSSLHDAEVVLEARVDDAIDALSTVAVGPVGATPTVPKYVLALSGRVRLIDKSAAVVWESGSVRVEEDYLSGAISCGTVPCSPGLGEAAIQATESNRRRALERAAEQLGNELYARLIEGF